MVKDKAAQKSAMFAIMLFFRWIDILMKRCCALVGYLVFIVLIGNLNYNCNMKNIYVICFLVFAFIWGMGIFFSYLFGLTKASIPKIKAESSTRTLLEEQHKISDDSEQKRKKTMEDYEDHLKRYKDTFPKNATGF